MNSNVRMMRSYRLLLRTSLLALSVTAAPVPTEAQVPEVVTPEWLVQEYLHGWMPTPEEAQLQTRVWLEIRQRPQTFLALRTVAEDSTQPQIVRNNAILRMGATSQPEAIEYLETLFARLEPGHPTRARILVGLGTGHLPAPERVTRLLSSSLRSSSAEERRAAVSGLGYLDTPQARALLRNQIEREPDPSLRIHIRDAIEWQRPTMERGASDPQSDPQQEEN